MKAVVINSYGGVDNLSVADVAVPEVGSDDVLVKVRFCGVNRLDVWIRTGKRQCKGFPHIMGSEISGEVAGIGNNVAVFPWLFCGKCSRCLNGEENMCTGAGSGTVGRTTDGGYAEYVRVPAANIVKLPENVSPEQAASVTLAAVTAWRMLKKAGIKRNETVLVLAAASGVGIYAVQLAKILGARVIAAASSDEKLALARKLGADETVNYAAADLEKEVMAFTGNKGVDVVAEQVGKETWSKSINCLAVGGRIITCGATTGSEAGIDILRLFQRHISIIGSSGGTRADLREILGFVSRELLKPVIHSVLPLEQAAEAHTLLESRQVMGKLLLEP